MLNNIRYVKPHKRTKVNIEALHIFFIFFSLFNNGSPVSLHRLLCRSSTSALSMFVHYPDITHRILNISPRLILRGAYTRGAYIWEDILISVQEACIRVGLIFDILRYMGAG